MSQKGKRESNLNITFLEWEAPVLSAQDPSRKWSTFCQAQFMSSWSKIRLNLLWPTSHPATGKVVQTHQTKTEIPSANCVCINEYCSRSQCHLTSQPLVYPNSYFQQIVYYLTKLRKMECISFSSETHSKLLIALI